MLGFDPNLWQSVFSNLFLGRYSYSLWAKQIKGENSLVPVGCLALELTVLKYFKIEV